MRRLAVLMGTVALAGCGGGDHGLKVAAASSLTGALTACGGGAQLEFGGSDDLAAQIRQGVGIDVFAAANMKLPRALAAERKAGAPVPFATNELVLAVPRSSRLHRFADLSRMPATKLAVGSPGVPVGDYTAQVLGRLPAAQRAAIEREVRTEEPDVKSIVGKLLTGAVDAGFVYRTDVRAVDTRIATVALPASLQPTVVYGVSVVRRSAAASRFVDLLLHGACASALRRAGFGPPPP